LQNKKNKGLNWFRLFVVLNNTAYKTPVRFRAAPQIAALLRGGNGGNKVARRSDLTVKKESAALSGQLKSLLIDSG